MQKTVTLVITGGIAAYKSLILIRRLKEAGVRVIPVMTRAAREFVTPLSVGALAAHTVYAHPAHEGLRFCSDSTSQRRLYGQNGPWSGRRFAKHGCAGKRQTDHIGAQHERGDVGTSSDPKQSTNAAQARR